MSANPINLVGGLATSANVIKSDLVAWVLARVPQVLADITELRNTVLAGQLVVTLLSNGSYYRQDTADTTTADDGVNCILSGDVSPKRFKPMTALAMVSSLNAAIGAITIVAGAGISVSTIGSVITITNNAPAPAPDPLFIIEHYT